MSMSTTVVAANVIAAEAASTLSLDSSPHSVDAAATEAAEARRLRRAAEVVAASAAASLKQAREEELLIQAELAVALEHASESKREAVQVTIELPSASVAQSSKTTSTIQSVADSLPAKTVDSSLNHQFASPVPALESMPATVTLPIVSVPNSSEPDDAEDVLQQHVVAMASLDQVQNPLLIHAADSVKITAPESAAVFADPPSLRPDEGELIQQRVSAMVALENISNPLLLGVVGGGFSAAAIPAVANDSVLGTSLTLPEVRSSPEAVIGPLLGASHDESLDVIANFLPSAQKVRPVEEAHHRPAQPVAQPDLLAMQAVEFQAALSLESDRIANERGSLGRAALDLALHPEVFATALVEAERAFKSADDSCNELRQDLQAARLDFSCPLTVHEELEIRALIHTSQRQSLRLRARVDALNKARVIAAAEQSVAAVVSVDVQGAFPTTVVSIETDANSESYASKSSLAKPAGSESILVESRPTSIDCDDAPQKASAPIQNTDSEVSSSFSLASIPPAATSPGRVAVKSIPATSKPSTAIDPADGSVGRVYSQIEAKRQSLRVSTAYMIEAERAKRVADKVFHQQALQRQHDTLRIQNREESLRIDRALHEQRASEKKAKIVEDFARFQACRQQNLRGDIGDSLDSRPPTRSMALIRDQDLLGALPSPSSNSDVIQVEDIDSDVDEAPSVSHIIDNKALIMSPFDADLHPLPSFTSRFVAPQAPKRHQRFQLEAARLHREASAGGTHDLHSPETDLASVSPFEESPKPALEDSCAVSAGCEGESVDDTGIQTMSSVENPSTPAEIPISADPVLISNSESKINSKSSCRVS